MKEHVTIILSNLRENGWKAEVDTLEFEFSTMENQIASSDPEGKRARNAERARIAGILNHKEAASHPTQAKAMAFETDLPVETVARIMSNTPAEATDRRILSIEERAAGLAEFGAASGDFRPSKTGPLDRAIAEHNRNHPK